MFTSLYAPPSASPGFPWLAKIIGDDAPDYPEPPRESPRLIVEIGGLKDEQIGRLIEDLQNELAERRRQPN